MVKTIPYGTDNYAYLIFLDREIVLFDSGSADEIIAVLESLQVTPTQLCITHHHRDHDAGTTAIQKRFPKITLVDESTEFLLDGGIVRLFTPGHCEKHYCYYIPEMELVITGDTLLAGGCGRCFTGDFDLLCRSLEMIGVLPESTKIAPGHEYLQANVAFLQSIGSDTAFYEMRLTSERFPSVGITLKEERRSNPFLRAAIAGDCAQFRSLRIMKDQF